MKLIVRFILSFVLLVPCNAIAELLIGGDITYIVQRGDTIEIIGAKLGVNWWVIAKQNNIDIRKPLKPGIELKINTRKVVPWTVDNGIIINIADKTLYYFKNNRLEYAVPVGLGKKGWRTPSGKFTILKKEKNPTWYVPQSIQAEMAREGKKIKTVVPPGPDNPLGRFALKTSIPGILIHETIWPGSVYQFRRHGCIRVMPEQMERLFAEVELHTAGELIYKPVKATVADGRIFLEVHSDYYKMLKDIQAEARRVIENVGAIDLVDWQRVDRVVREKTGIAEDVTL